MRITVNLATRPFADVGPAIKRLRIGMGVLAFLALLLALSLRAIHEKAEEARAREHSLDGEIARVTTERQGYQNLMKQPENAQLLVQAAALNKLFDEKSFSWTLAMEDLETVLPGGVQVVTIEPVRAKDGHIELRLKVVGPRDKAVELVSNLEHSRRFLLPRIVGENAETSSAPGQRLEPVSASNRFDLDLLANYNPAGPGERRALKSKARAEDSGEMGVSDVPIAGPADSAIGHGHGRAPYTGTSKPFPSTFIPNRPTHPAPGGPQ